MMGDYPMKTRAILTLGLSALVIGAAVASASTMSAARMQKMAADDAAKASHALGKGKLGPAVKWAEEAVEAQPDNAGYRVLLGNTYLKAGRFASARQTFADALSLDPANGRAALNLALAQIGTGQWQQARGTLDAHKDSIPASDRGLAMALAGDPQGAVALLTDVVRDPGADAKARQNLALSLALAGRWQDARVMAAMDLPPAEVDKRIMAWASFAQPKSASDQVAALLGVVPVADPGQPAILALTAPAPVALASTETPPAAPQPEADTAVADAPAPAPVEVADAAPVAPKIVFGPRQEIVQQLPAKAARPAPVAMAAVVRPVAMGRVTSDDSAPAKGGFFVQLGAYQNAGAAHTAWGRATGRFGAFAGKAPSSTSINVKGKTFYRLSVGGYARPDADKLCTGYRAKGGKCFVRAAAGDQVASWGKGAQVASR